MAKSTKGAKGSGTLKKRTVNRNGREYTYWEGQITLGRDPGTGKQKRKTFTGQSQKEVLAKMQAASVKVSEGDYFEPTKLTVKAWFEIWLAEYSADKKPLTIQQYQSMAKTHIYPAIGAVQLAKLTAPMLQKFYNQLAKTGKTLKRKDPETGKTVVVEEPLSAKTIRNIHGIMSKALNTAVLQGMIRENVSNRTTIPKVIRKEIKPLTEEQQKEFIKAMKGHDYRNLFTVILFTGLREGEALGLTWDCIDFAKGTMKVYRQLQRIPGDWGNTRFAPLKNSKTRLIKLSPYVIGILAEQKTKQLQEKFKAKELWQGFQNDEEWKESLVFTDDLGGCLKTATVYSNFKKIAAQIGAPEARLHDLRHTFAVISLQNGDDLKTVQDNLGHATAAFTLDVYGHVSEKMKEASASRQQEYIKKSLGL